ncbi:hypothetical protein AX16_005135 [Volvariella volvacea WC 439]|nr:hypothetical protein AX16_005135 [Volvariella volvacea WC 439]
MAYSISHNKPSSHHKRHTHSHSHQRHNHPSPQQQHSWSIGTALNSDPLASSSTPSSSAATINTSSTPRSASVSAPPTASGSSSHKISSINTSVGPAPPGLSLSSPTAVFSPHHSRHGALTLQPYHLHHHTHHHPTHPHHRDQTQSHTHHHPLSPTRELSEIIPQIYISDLSFAESASSLTAHKITHILSVLPDTIYTPPPSLLPAQPKRLQIKVEDSPFAELAVHLPQTTQWIAQAVESGPDARVLVHCAEGISRSVSVVAAFLMTRFGWSPSEALGFVKSKRRVADPNFGFVEQLFEYGRNVLGQNCWSNREAGGATGAGVGGGGVAVQPSLSTVVEGLASVGSASPAKSTPLGTIMESSHGPSVIVPKAPVPFALPSPAPQVHTFSSIPPPAPILDTDMCSSPISESAPTTTTTSAASSTSPSPSTAYPPLTSLSSLSSLPRLNSRSKASRSTLSLVLPPMPVSVSRQGSGSGMGPPGSPMRASPESEKSVSVAALS